MRAVLGGLAVVSVLLVTAAARAEVIGVSNAGMDTGACGSAPRCETIHFAINLRAAVGDTVLVEPGTYSTAAAAPIDLKTGVSVRGASGDPADVTVTSNGMNDVFRASGPLSGSTISALTIVPGPGTGTTTNAGIHIDDLFEFDVVDAVIENNRFVGGENGIIVFNDDDDGNSYNAVNLSPTIRGNLFTGQFVDGIRFEGEDVSGALKIVAPQISSNMFELPGDDAVNIACVDWCEGTYAPTIRQNQVMTPGGDGIAFVVSSVSNSASSPYIDLNPLIEENTIIGAGDAAIDVVWGDNEHSYDNALVYFRPTIVSNTVSGAGGADGAAGIEVSVDEATNGDSMVFVGDIAVTGNTVSGATQDGIRILASNLWGSGFSQQGFFVHGLIADNVVSGNEANGIALAAIQFGDEVSATVNAQIAMSFEVTDNMVSENDVGGIVIAAAHWFGLNTAAVALAGTISGNTVMDNGTDPEHHGINFIVSNWRSVASNAHLAPTLVDIRENTVTGNAGAGIAAQAIGVNTSAEGFALAATIADNLVAENLASGVELRFSDTGAAGFALLDGNTVTGNGGTALLIELQDDCSECGGFSEGPVGVALRNNTITSGGGDAIRINAADGTTSGGVLTNIVNAATFYAIDLGGGFYDRGSPGKNVIQGFATAGSGGTCEDGAFCDIVNHGPNDVTAECNEFTAADAATEEDFVIDDTDDGDLGDIDPLSICPVPAPAGVSIEVSAMAGADTGACGMVGAPCATIAHALTLADDGDTVLVMPGTYNSSAIGLASGVSIQGSTGDPADVRIIGSGGNIFEAFGPLSSSTVVSGLTIDAGVCGTATFECDGPIGIFMSVSSGFSVVTPVIENNRFEGGCCGIVGANEADGVGALLAPTIRENFFTGQESDAIFFIANDSGEFQMMAPEILSNTMQSPGFDGVFMVLSDSGEGTLAPLVHGNMVTEPGLEAIHFTASDLDVSEGRPFLRFLPLVSGNTVSGLGEEAAGILAGVVGIDESASNGIVIFEPTITGNTVTGTGADGDSNIGIGAAVAAIGTSFGEVDSLVVIGDVTVRENIVTDMGGDGILVGLAGLAGMEFGALIFDATFADNSVADNGAEGIDVELTGWFDQMSQVQVAANVTLTGNTISGNAERGIDFEADSWSEMIGAEVALGVTITANTVSANGDDGIAVLISDWEDVATFDGGLAPVLVAFADNTVTDNGGAGIVAEARDIDGDVPLQFAPTLTGNVITGNMSEASGVEIRYTDTGAAGMAILTRNQITQNNGTGVLIDLVGDDEPAGGPVNVALRNNTIDGGGGDAVKVNGFGIVEVATNYQIDLGGGFFNRGSEGRNVLKGMSTAMSGGDCTDGAFCDINNLGPNEVSALCNEFTSDDIPDCNSGAEENFLNDDDDDDALGNVCPISACLVVCTEDADCDDGLACNGEETCVGVGMPGADSSGCLAGEPVDCNDNFSCTMDTCTEPEGTCTSTPVDDSCNDQVDCTMDSCDPMNAAADADGCVFAPDDGSCDDFVDCTDDTCNPMLGPGSGCQSTPNDDNCADDGNVCTDEACDAMLGCHTSFNTDSCDDGFSCTIDDMCNGSGECIGNPSNAACNDGDVCTADTCDPMNAGAGADGCVHASTDSDGDGVCDFIEDGAPNGGDGNDDGTPDSTQPHVTSLPNVVKGAYMTVISESCQLTNVAAVPLDIPDVLLPFGGLSFELLECETSKVTVLYHDTDHIAQPPFEYFKKGPNPPGAGNDEVYTLSTGAPHFTMFGTQSLGFDNAVGMVMFTLSDDVVGDDTGDDGNIIDQGGPGIRIEPAPVPALTPLGLLIVLLALSGVALLALRRLRSRPS